MVDYSQYVFFDSWKSLLLGATSLTIVYGLLKLFNRFLIAPIFSPLRDLPGPKNPSLIYGHFREIFKADPGELHAKWVQDYGPTLVYKGLFGRDRIMTLDTKALSHILGHSYDWQKPEEVRTNLAQLLGEGVLFAEGDAHKRQRRIMNPSFSLSHLRDLTVIFHEKSQQLRDIWLTQAAENGGSYSTNVLPWLGKATLDIIGLAGFDYKFNALNPEGQENELNKAFMTIFKQGQRLTPLAVLQAFVPVFRWIPSKRGRSIQNARKVMNRIGLKLVAEKKAAILATAAAQGTHASGEVLVEKSSVTTRDLLSRLMIANMATDLPESQRLSDEDVLAQIPTFLVAGNETTSTATAWCLYALSLNPTVQAKLREELLSIGTDNPSMDELNSLRYLDGVVHETLRLHSPVTATVRHANVDDIVPLAIPFKDRKGQLRYEIRVRKGDTMFIPILSLNTYKGIWGDDAQEFRPERWYQTSEKIPEVPGITRGLLTFLGGPRACIGYRFALVEFKCLIFALVRAFAFEPADPAMKIVKKSNIVTRPMVESEPEKGAQLPLRITPWKGM